MAKVSLLLGVLLLAAVGCGGEDRVIYRSDGVKASVPARHADDYRDLDELGRKYERLEQEW